jgi:hypothetical protein
MSEIELPIDVFCTLKAALERIGVDWSRWPVAA